MIIVKKKKKPLFLYRSLNKSPGTSLIFKHLNSVNAHKSPNRYSEGRYFELMETDYPIIPPIYKLPPIFIKPK